MLTHYNNLRLLLVLTPGRVLNNKPINKKQKNPIKELKEEKNHKKIKYPS